jgi:hypothetical protein
MAARLSKHEARNPKSETNSNFRIGNDENGDRLFGTFSLRALNSFRISGFGFRASFSNASGVF